MKKVEECPKCGGKNGYSQIFRVSYCQYYYWNGEPESASEIVPQISAPVIPVCRCVDCGKTVKLTNS